jgi:hypothetical protein
MSSPYNFNETAILIDRSAKMPGKNLSSSIQTLIIWLKTVNKHFVLHIRQAIYSDLDAGD